MRYIGLRKFTVLVQVYYNLHESVKGDLPGIGLISRFIGMSEEKKYKSFRDFYPFYLTEHQNPVSRGLHFIGTGLIIGCLIAGIITEHGVLRPPYEWSIAETLGGRGERAAS